VGYGFHLDEPSGSGTQADGSERDEMMQIINALQERVALLEGRLAGEDAS
jgi:hypothetical protein